MPIDTSVYNNLRTVDFGGAIEKGLTLREMADQRMQRQKALQDNEKIRDAYKAGIVEGPDGKTTTDYGRTISELAKGGFGEQAMGLQQKVDAQKAVDLDRRLKETTLVSQALGGVSDQAGWDRAKDYLRTNGVDIAQYETLPYSPKTAQDFLGMTLTAKDRLEKQYKDREYGLREREVRAKEMESGVKSGATAGQKKVDQDFATDYNDWTSGGSESARAEIEKLGGVATQLKNKSLTTGGLTGVFPDRMTSNKVLSARSDVQSTIMKSLRTLMGASFTEKEGERVIKNTWNEADSTENNEKRLERLKQDLLAQADAKDAKAKYFQKRGSLAGYKPAASLPAGESNEQKVAQKTFKTKDIEWAD